MMTVSQGAHLVLDASFLPGNTALMVPQTDDGRVLFAIPWHGRVLVGTTDTPVKEPALEPTALREEIDFLLEHAGRYLAKQPTQNDIRSVFAGLRPLAKGGGKTSSIARDHVLAVSPSGLVTITGGKWTTYRKMAEDTVNKAIEVGRLESRPCQTMELALHGAGGGGRRSEDGSQKSEVSNQQTEGVSSTASPGEWDLSVYGADASAVQSLARERMEWNERLHPKLPYRVAEVVWTVRQEMARTVEDVLARRLRALTLDACAAAECAPKVAALLSAELGRDADWQARQVKSFADLAATHLPRGTPH
jgi:glycerol-3-phosphate dehydrogenase